MGAAASSVCGGGVFSCCCSIEETGCSFTVSSSAPINPLPLSVPDVVVDGAWVAGAVVVAEVPSPTGCGFLKITCCTESKSRVFSKSLTFFYITSCVSSSTNVSSDHSC